MADVESEHELKFAPGPLFQVPDLTSIPGLCADPPEEIRLQAVYFDTDDFRLARAGASLRHRDPEGWTVKLPIAHDSSSLTRTEHHVPGENSDEPPDAAVDLVRALIRSAALTPVARLNTVRNRIELRDEGGERTGELVDDEVSLLDGARLAARFRELEVELEPSVSSAFVSALIRRLRAAGAGQPDPVPKIVRALGPRAAEPPDLAEARPLDFASTPEEVVQAAITNGTLRLVANDPAVRLGEDPEGVHQARVATRRLRSDLRTFRSVLDEEWSEPLRDELKWLGGLLGAVRDTEVLLERLEARVEELPASDADDGKQLLQLLTDRREYQRSELLDAMRSDRYLALLDTLVAASRAPRFADASDVGDDEDEDDDDVELADFVRKPWRKLKKSVHALGEDPSDHELHRVRIRAKRARYAAEAVAAALGKKPRKFAKAVADLQDVLGEHQDAVVAEAWLREHRGTAPFVAGELVAIERAAARAAREEWPEVWEHARAKKLRKWM
jgi:CHAD domain-containing protein